jgi:hypothetical protein
VIGRVRKNVNGASVIAKEEIDKVINVKMSELGNDKLDVSLKEEEGCSQRERIRKRRAKRRSRTSRRRRRRKKSRGYGKERRRSERK